MNLDAAWAVVGFALAESLRRRVFVIVIVLTVLFLALYGVGAHFAFEQASQLRAFDTRGRRPDSDRIDRSRAGDVRRRCSSGRCSPSS